jgi:hypothetical protein
VIDPASLGSVYREGIVEAGKEPAFLFLVAFLGSFAFIRTSTHMIRAGVSWWPGNVSVGGTHIHHLVWGILLLLISGWISIAIDPGSPGRELVAVAFGIGTGLTLDEFALWLELRDVYWTEEGRKSIDAVIVAAILAGFGVLGFGVWIDLAEGVEAGVRGAVGLFGIVSLVLAVVNAAKQKFGVAALGLVVLPVGVAGALRLARPRSLWARTYSEQKLARARARFGSAHRHGPRTDAGPPGSGPT